MKRPIRIEGDVAYVPLTQGYEAVIDAADAELAAQRNWYAMIDRRPDGTIRSVYAAGNSYSGGVRRVVFLHREILGLKGSPDADHWDNDGLNNRRANLRPASRSQNNFNQGLRYNSGSGIKGVTFDRQTQKWRAQIQAHGKRHPIGRFLTKEDAAAAYAEASARLHGEFGRTALEK